MGQGTQLLGQQQQGSEHGCVLDGIPCAALLFDRHGKLLASNSRADDLHIGASLWLDVQQLSVRVCSRQQRESCSDGGGLVSTLLTDAACMLSLL